jgi:hypothetical protein
MEDQLAATADPPRVAYGAQRSDGRVTVAVAARDIVEAIAASEVAFARAVPEPSLVPFADHWTLYESATGHGFIRTPAGAFAVTLDRDMPPAELEAALAQARRAGNAPDAVHVAFRCDGAVLDRYAEATRVPFTATAPWHWTHADEPRFAAAPDWLAARADAATSNARRTGRFRWALGLVAAALVLHVGATLTQWLGYRWSAWRTEQAIVALAQEAGVDASTPAAAITALVRRNSDERHRAGLLAPGDALPLLAQAAPALAQLPAGTLKSAVYADGAWTIDLAKADAAALARVDALLAQRGVAVLQAPTASGTRMRMTATP